jgi:hypothetical protein
VKAHVPKYLVNPPDDLAKEIRAIIEQAPEGLEKQEQGVYQSLVQAGLDHVIDRIEGHAPLTLKGYRRLLIDQGLSAPHASEIHKILQKPDLARRFATGGPEGCGVREAIAEARAGKTCKVGKSQSTRRVNAINKRQARKKIVSALNRLLKHKDLRVGWEIRTELYILRFTPAAVVAKPTVGLS